MFATISSFLPAALQNHQEPKSPNPNVVKEIHESVEQVEPRMEADRVDEVGVKKREKRTNETFIIVRPPPAKSNHPLNLQVQLVPPQIRERSLSQRRSVDLSSSTSHDHDVEQNVLSRTNSNRSDVSMFSGYSSTISFSSVSSSSGSGSRRMIIPLYNLQAHNVMTNVVVDAGTDAKVAKYMRRGLEVLGLAVLEPIEVFGTNSTLTSKVPPLPSSTRTSMDGVRPVDALYLNSLEPPHTPMSSAYSVSSAGLDTPVPPSANIVARPDDAPPSATGAKKMFGKLFKKKLVSNSPSAIISSPPASPSPSTSSFMKPSRSKTLNAPSGNSKRSSFLPTSASVPPLSAPLDTSFPTAQHSSSVILQPACLGIQPSLCSPTNTPRGRPHSYSWVVRRWIKGADKGIFGNVMGMMNPISSSDDRRNSHLPPDESSAVEVQFIWSRGRTKAKKRREQQSESGIANEPQSPRSRTIARRRSTALSSSNAPSTTSLDKASRQQKRLSITSDHHSVSTAPTEVTWGRRRPWKPPMVRRVTRRTLKRPGSARLSVATLAPTPHHPKVVSLLKIPFPLPDVVVDQMKVRRRTLNPQGIARPSWDTEAEDGLVLTAEEIKDVVSCTGLWLVVREGIGGVGKVNRKGDGWRIRA